MADVDAVAPVSHLRTQFWDAAHAVLQRASLDWALRFDRLDALVDEHGGHALMSAPAPRGAPAGELGWLGGPEATEDRGPRGFLIPWSLGERTSIHGHPDVMYVRVLSGRFLIEDYRLTADGTLVPTSSRTLVAGERCAASVHSDLSAPVIHRITCIDRGQTLHIYSDDPARAPRYEEMGHDG